MITPKKLYGNKPATSSATLYTAPAGGRAIVKNVILCNTTATAGTVTLVTGGNPFVSSYSVGGNDTVTIDLTLVMEAGEILTGLQGTAGAIAVTVSGVEVV